VNQCCCHFLFFKQSEETVRKRKSNGVNEEEEKKQISFDIEENDSFVTDFNKDGSFQKTVKKWRFSEVNASSPVFARDLVALNMSKEDSNPNTCWIHYSSVQCPS
jgi:hypothetical protein